MPFSEDDLRAALKPKDPGPDFTRRVMARLNEAKTQANEVKRQPKSTAPSRARAWRFWFAGLKFGPALAAALAVLLMVGAWVGYQSYQRHQQEANNAQQQRDMEAKRAEQQAMLALRITSEKLNHVFQKVNGAVPPEDKIRRQRL